MILPLKDSIPTLRKPVMTWSVIVCTFCIFIWQQNLGPKEFHFIVMRFGLTPALALGMERLEGFVAYTFLHAGWLHAISNLWTLWIFADNVEDVMGPVRFLLFYILCGVFAGIAHIAANPGSTMPVIGASGAISGVLGAYFLLYPHARITTFVFFLILRIPAALYLGGWFLFQLWSGFKGSPGNIAWWAHFGGFVAGMVLLPLFRTNRPLPPNLSRPDPPPPAHDPKDPWARFRNK